MTKQKKHNKLQKQSANQPYRRRFVIATEGSKTEREYFSHIIKPFSCYADFAGKKDHSAPEQVLASMEDLLEKKKLNDSDQAWLVVDRDDWQPDQLNKLQTWAQGGKNRFVAVSNPKFEYWLLLHFDNGNRIKSPKDVDNRLKKYLPNYKKDLKDTAKITPDNTKKAIDRIKEKDRTHCTDCDWPKTPYFTTVYRLVENILACQ